MKLVLVAGVAAILFLFAPSASAQTACRDYDDVAELKQRDLSSVIVVEPSSVLASVTFEDRTPTDTFAIRGTFCDSDLAPLAGHRLRVILVVRDEGDSYLPLPADAFETGLARAIETRSLVTSEQGEFMVSGLSAGEYVLDVAWEELPATPRVVFDLRHLPGPPLRSSIEQVGLIRP